MSIIEQARGIVVERGYSYYRSGKVYDVMQLNDHEYEGYVNGSGKQPYYVKIDINHPRKSSCTCPYAEGNKICKHMVALYFYVFPDEAQEYNEWLESDDYEDEYEEDWYDDCDYDDHYSNNFHSFEKPLFFDYVLNSFIEQLNEKQAKELLKTQFENHPEQAYDQYLKKDYEKLLKQNNKDFLFLERLKNKVEDMIPYYNYEDIDYSKKILSDREKNIIIKLYHQYKDMVDEILLKPELAIYDDMKWIIIFYKENEVNLDDYYQQLEKQFIHLKHSWIQDTISKSNVLIIMYLIKPGSRKQQAKSLLKNAKYKEYVDYVLNVYGDDQLIYKEVLKQLQHSYLKYRKTAPLLLGKFLMNSKFRDQNRMYYFSMYSFLCDKNTNDLDLMVKYGSREKAIKDIESITKDTYTLICLYGYFDMNKKLWDLLNQGDNRRLLIYHVELLKKHYSKELYQDFYQRFYATLKQGKKREIYRDACVYVKGISQLNQGKELIEKLITELQNSSYAKCSALFDEINKVIKYRLK